MMPDDVVIFAARYLFLVIPVAAFVYWLLAPPQTKKYLIVLGAIVGVVSLAIGLVIAHFYFDPRPFVTGHVRPLIAHAADNGFPSDHTLLSAAIAATVTACNPPFGIALWVITALVGIARVASSLHHAIDVLGSMVIAGSTAAVAHALLRFWRG